MEDNNFFVAGARPCAIWVGVFSLLYAGLGISLLNWLTSLLHLPAFPQISESALDVILYGLLGFGGLRTVDKVKGVDTKRVIK